MIVKANKNKGISMAEKYLGPLSEPVEGILIAKSQGSTTSSMVSSRACYLTTHSTFPYKMGTIFDLLLRVVRRIKTIQVKCLDLFLAQVNCALHVTTSKLPSDINMKHETHITVMQHSKH